MAKTKKTAADEGVAVIQPANMVTVTVRIRGTAPLVQAAFSGRQIEILMDRMTKKPTDKKTKDARPPRDYDREFEQAQHRAVAGWNGIPCGAFRRGMVDACRTVNLVMTRAKMALFVHPDGFDAGDATPLVRFYSANPPEQLKALVRNDNGSADIRVRPMWREWYADLRIEFDADMITAESVVNLLDRAGRQVGVGEGRPFSKNSTGMGWGTFTVETTQATTEAA